MMPRVVCPGCKQPRSARWLPGTRDAVLQVVDHVRPTPARAVPSGYSCSGSGTQVAA